VQPSMAPFAVFFRQTWEIKTLNKQQKLEEVATIFLGRKFRKKLTKKGKPFEPSRDTGVVHLSTCSLVQPGALWYLKTCITGFE
jgi:hypothetical protein